MNKTIEFDAKEIDIILHRLEVLDEDSLEGIFNEVEGFDAVRAAEYVEALIISISQKDFSIELSIPEAGEIIRECFDGSTFFRPHRDMIRDKQISASTAARYVKAAKSAAIKIEEATGLEVNPHTESDRDF